jgi:hypothetical protein
MGFSLVSAPRLLPGRSVPSDSRRVRLDEVAWEKLSDEVAAEGV